MKFLAMHITNQKLSFDIFMVGNLQNIFMEHDLNILMIFVIKEKWIILTSYNVLLSIATNIPVLLMTAFVLQSHIVDTNFRRHILSLYIAICIVFIKQYTVYKGRKSTEWNSFWFCCQAWRRARRCRVKPVVLCLTDWWNEIKEPHKRDAHSYHSYH